MGLALLSAAVALASVLYPTLSAMSTTHRLTTSYGTCQHKTDDSHPAPQPPLRMRELGVYDMMSEETTPFLWYDKLMIVEKIGGNTIILPI
eukprot:SAG11_NODE_10406_length_834_cov_1.112925_1_plen_91_part_00